MVRIDGATAYVAKGFPAGAAEGMPNPTERATWVFLNKKS